jgi:hypothetical protein
LGLVDRREVLPLHVRLDDLPEPGLQARLRLVDSDAWRETSDGVDPERTRRLAVDFRRHLRLHHRRDPHCRRAFEGGAVKCLRRDADDRHRLLVDQDAAVDHVGRAKPVHPVVMREHHDRMQAGVSVVVRPDQAAEHRNDTERLEVRARDELGPHRDVLASGRDVDVRGVATGERLEYIPLPGEVAAQWIGQQAAEPVIQIDRVAHPAQLDQPFRLTHRQRTRQHLIEQREDAGVGTNAQRE